MANREAFCPALYRSRLGAGAGKSGVSAPGLGPAAGLLPRTAPPGGRAGPVTAGSSPGLCFPGLRERGQGPPFSRGSLLKLIMSSRFVFQVTVVSIDPLVFTPRSTSSSQTNKAFGPVLFSEGKEAQPSLLHTAVYQSQHQLTTERLD